MGAQVIAEFVDAGESARSANRPELQDMLKAIGQHRISFVVVHKVDRLARNRQDDLDINLQLKAVGTQLVSCSENIDETPGGQLMHGIMSSIAEFYSLNLAAEAKKGMLQKAKGGGTPGRAPFGYKNVVFRDDLGREVRAVETDPDRASWVQWIYERYATGEWTTQMLAAELRENGVTRLATPKRPATPIAVSQVAHILSNRYYVGVVSYMGVEYPGTHQALISEALFAQARAVREGRVTSRDKSTFTT
jgi:site-specific DNA recombinase